MELAGPTHHALWTTGSAWAFVDHEVPVAVFAGLELGPLIGSQDAADAEEHPGIGLFKLSAGVRNMVDLGEDLVRVGRIGVEHGLKNQLLPF